MTTTKASSASRMPSISQIDNPCKQQVSPSGRIKVPKAAWLIRISILSIIAIIIWYILSYSIETLDIIMMVSLILPVHTLAITVIGWVWYKNPAASFRLKTNPKVTVIIPVYNQAPLIEHVVDGIFESTYRNIEVIAVNDGSKDGTKEALVRLAERHERLIVIDKKNQGKRKAVGSGFMKATGDYVILVDSDSIIDPHAIEEFVKAFESNPHIGAAVGHVKVLNANKNVLTKCQDAWYDFAFNVQKSCESAFGSVTCCSGCLACYRRRYIEKFMPYWMKSTVDCSDDRELTSFIIAPKFGKLGLSESLAGKSKLGEKLMLDATQYDDAEDRILTAHALTRSNAVYIASAIAYTDVPETFRKFTRQQERWKKGYLRTNFYVSTFFWKRNPLMAFLYYTEYAASFITPFIALGVTVYQPLVLGHYWLPLTFLSLLMFKGFLLGSDYRMRDSGTRNWKYNVLMSLLSQFVVSWMLIPALLHIRNNKWGTR
jgi:hyaluronan synthase